MLRKCVLALIGAIAGMAAVGAAAEPKQSAGASPKAAGVRAWDGLYGGVNVGYGWGDKNGGSIAAIDTFGVPYPTGPLSYDLDLSGPFGGAQIGYGLQAGRIVLGLEADIQRSGID